MAIRKGLVSSLTSGGPDEVPAADALGCPKLAGTTTTPSITVSGLTLGTPGATLAGNDLSATLTIGVGLVGGTLTATITPTSAYPAVPRVQIQPANAAAAQAVMLGFPYQDYANSTASLIKLVFPLSVNLASQTLVFNLFACC